MKSILLKGFCLIVLTFSLIGVSAVKAQNINQQNFSSIRVDELSDDQIRQFMKQVEATGLSDTQLEQVAIARGMSTDEVAKLRDRVNRIKTADAKRQQTNQQGNKTIGAKQQQGGRNYTQQSAQDSLRYTNQDSLRMAEKLLAEFKPKIFGADLFRNTNLSFEPNLRLATPQNYVVGPDDQLLIDITGNSEASYQLKVSPEGTINIEYAGVVQVGGMTIEQATARIKSKLATIYSGLRNGSTRLNVAVGDIRSIKVTLVGEVAKPGSYTLPSLATVFNALYASGGPTDNGTFRSIEVVRGNRVVGKLDIYDFLLKGFQTNNIRLQDNDVIRVPTYQTRVEFSGEVKRPYIFETLPNETLADALNFAGGFTERAYSARVKVLQNTSKERKITDVFADQFSTYKPQNGDKYFVEQILERFENRVTINGAVFRPGQFELTSGLTLSQLIKKADGVKEDAFLERGYITRLNPDNSTQLISFDVRKIISGSTADISLMREDVISINSIFDLRDEYRVSIDGEVRSPGTFNYSDNMTVEELVLKAGGFKEGASPNRVEISRRTKSSDVTSTSAVSSEVFQVNINPNLSLSQPGFVLQPFDIVSIRSSTGFEIQKQVKVEGEVLYPGMYTITRKDERVSDILKRAGGFTALAYPEGASLRRPGPPKDTLLTNDITKFKDSIEVLQQQVIRLKRMQQLQSQTTINNSSGLLIDEESTKNEYVGIDLTRILKDPGKKDDIFLEEGDVLYVPKQLQTVKISGEVLSPVTVIYDKSKGFKTYINNGGGFSQRALKKRSYVIYANGSVKTAKKFFFFNNYPSVSPGAEIFVPKKDPAKRVSAAELVGITTGLASLAAIIVSLLK
ncbi:capsule biosynthesis protein [Pedobacter sp. HMF7647]|uniref:Capsule biosynthesis protein n=1 Tax=Hufsiella arboris TaxID=2695275 RepID=A0A7K1YAT8_9SPHI|nr:SLBB domain-containing protein [Hufsiella arboris]MXV51696.1 capsule biosynthesis protein [Hufsiella arboris]